MNLSKSSILTYRLLLTAALIVISFLATTSSSVPVVEDINDKVEHGIAFYALALLADFSFPRTDFGRAKALSLIVYGLGIETIQYFLPYRTFSLFDLGADAAGLFAYGISIPALRQLPLFKERWK